MKRLISLFLTIAMLAGMCITAGAALPAVTEYVIDENTAISDSNSGNPYSYVPGKVFAGFRSGDDLPGKNGDSVYEMTYTNSSQGAYLRYTPVSHTYADGDIVHLSTELMIPAGTSFALENMKRAPGLALEVADSAGNAYGLAVKNDGNKDSNNYAEARTMLVGFNPVNQRFILFGNSVYSDQSWEYDRWYRIDVVLVMGSDPKAAVYVNGNPLTVNPKHGITGTGEHHYDPGDATFDGIKTSTDYVDIGRHTGTLKVDKLVYEETDMYQVKQFYPVHTFSNTASPNKTIYADNIFMKALEANETPDIPAPLSIAGVEDGATLEHDELKALSINVPLWQRETAAKVAISVDGAEAIVDTAAPFTFDLRGIDRGVRNIDITTYDSSDNVLSTGHQTIVVAGNEKITRVEEEFESNILNGDFWARSTRASDFNDSKKITNEAIVDSYGVSYGNSVKLYSNNSTVKYGWGPVVNEDDSWDTTAWPAYTDGLINVSYDMYLDNKNASAISFKHQDDKGYQFLAWDSANQKFVTNKNWTGTTAAVSFDAEVKKWQKWDWTFDYDKGTVSLKIDGDTKLDKVAMHATAKGFGFPWWMIEFNSGTASENYIGFDNFKVTKENAINDLERNMYYANEGKDYSNYDWQYWMNIGWFCTLKTPVPSSITNGGIKSAVVDGTAYNADFGESVVAEFSNLDTYAAGQYIRIPMALGFTADTYATPNGTTEIEYDYYLDNTAYEAVGLEMGDLALWSSNGAASTAVKLTVDANKVLNGVLTPGKWQHHKFVFYPNPDGGIAKLQFYVDGKLLYDGVSAANSKYTYTWSKAPYIAWRMAGAQDSTNTGKFAANKFAVDNIRVSYKPITPVITSVVFGDGMEKDGKVLSTADSFTVNVAGTNLTLTDKVTVKEEGADVGLGTAAANGNTVTVSGLNLEAGKKYVVELAAGLGYDLQGCTTKDSSTYVFEAVEEFDEVPVITDGVDDAVTATDMRFTINQRSVSVSPVATYNGGRIPMNYHLRADVKINNNSAEKKTVRALIATYEDGELTGIALGNEYTINAYAKDWVITTGSIIRDVDTTPDIKVMLVNDMNDIIPVSSSFDMEQ